MSRTINLVRTSGVPILRQLILEEALYRTSQESWFLVNDGSAETAIVLGLSGYVSVKYALMESRQDGGCFFPLAGLLECGARAISPSFCMFPPPAPLSKPQEAARTD